MKNIKLRIIIYVVVFIAAAVLTYIVKIGKTGENKTTTSMTSAGLPIVYMTTDSGLEYNYLHGYTCEVQQNLLRDAITPISTDRKFTVSIKQYGAAVSGVGYEIRSLDGEKLIERTDVANYSGSNGIITATLEPKNLLDSKTEYMLKIILTTEKYGDVSYYTRIVMMDKSNIDEKLQYVLNFSNYTYSEETLKNIMAKLETDKTRDNTNLGRVNIHSKLSQVGYGELHPVKESSTYAVLNEIDGDKASFTLNYISSTDDGNRYDVKEFYRINQVSQSVTYVYNFDRFMEQIYVPEGSVTNSGKIYLGIASNEDVQMKADSTGKYTCFVRDNTLWNYRSSTGKCTSIFSFAEEDSDGIRENYKAHDIKILNVDNKGNVKFLVYGYMNRGLHEGKLGISLYTYNAEKNYTEELIFIPRTDVYNIISGDVNILSYVNSNNIMYICINGSIYYIDCITKEYMTVANNIVVDNCHISEKTATFIYQTSTKGIDSTELNILHLDTGEIYTIKANQGETIKSLGFIDDNIVYGTAVNNTENSNIDDRREIPMYKISLMNNKYQIVKEYQKENINVSSVIFSGNKIEMKLTNSDGSSAGTDYLLSNKEDKTSSLSITSSTTEVRQKEIYIVPITPGTETNINRAAAKYQYAADTTIYISMDGTDSYKNMYYAFGYGEMYSYGLNLGNIIQDAADSGGVVTNSHAKVIWNRYKDSKATVNIPDTCISSQVSTAVSAMDTLLKINGKDITTLDLYNEGKSIAECLSSYSDNVYNLKGCTTEQLQYYISNGYPVLIGMGADSYELLYSYAQNTLHTINMTTGEKKSYSKKDMDTIISQYGNALITIGD